VLSDVTHHVESEELSSSSYDTDKVASLFGPPTGKKLTIPAQRYFQVDHNDSISPIALTPTASRDAQPESSFHVEGSAVLERTKSNHSMAHFDSGSMSSPIKMVVESSSAKNAPMLQKQGRTPSRGASFKRDISDRFLNLNCDGNAHQLLICDTKVNMFL
jgi:hypothetical protein